MSPSERASLCAVASAGQAASSRSVAEPITPRVPVSARSSIAAWGTRSSPSGI